MSAPGDVVQEAFLRAFRRLDQYDERARFSSWLHRIQAVVHLSHLGSKEAGEFMLELLNK